MPLEQSDTQHGILRELSKPVRNTEDTPLTIVTGPAGTGKSFVLRMHSRQLTATYLNGVDAVRRLPIMIPLQQFPVKTNTDVWESVKSDWLDWANQVAPQPQPVFTPEWLEQRFSQEPTTLVLDSVDEFLTESASLRPRDFRAVVTELRKRLRETGRKTSLILGIRSTDLICHMLREDADRVLVVRPLSVDEAAKYFPAAAPVIERARQSGNEEALEVACTPLVLSAFEDDAAIHGSAADVTPLGTRAEILQVAAHAYLRKSRLHELKGAEGKYTHQTELKQALSFIAKFFSAGHRGAMSRADIASEAVKLRDAWTAQSPAAGLLSDAFALFADDKLSRALMARTFFFPTADDSYRFQHREWHDFFLGSYLALCVRHHNLDEMTKLAFTQRAFQTAGELLQSEGWGEESATLIRAALDRMKRPGGQFVFGNLGGLLANSELLISDAALQELERRLDDMPTPGKLTFFAGLGYRLLRSWPREEADPTWSRLYDKFVTMFQRCLAQTTGQHVLVASLSWCYLTAFRSLCENTPHVTVPADPGPRPELPPAGELTAAEDAKGVVLLDRLLLAAGPDGLATPPEYKSVQVAYLRIQNQADVGDVLRVHPRLISLVHYLYALSWTLRLKQGGECVAVLDVREGVRSILKSPRIHDLYRGYEPVRDLAEIFQKAKSIAGV